MDHSLTLGSKLLGQSKQAVDKFTLFLSQHISAQDRQSLLTDTEFMKGIRDRYQEEAPTMMAALLEGSPFLQWSKGAGTLLKSPGSSPTVYVYSSPFLTEMQARAKDPTTIAPLDKQIELLCFESVLYALYLGGLLKAQEIEKLFAKAMNVQATRLPKDWDDFARLWAVLTPGSSLTYGRPTDLPQQKEYPTAGLAVFMGPSTSGEQFWNNVPWHVGVTVGEGDFVGIPGPGENNRQARASMVAFGKEKEGSGQKYLVAFGSSMATVAQRVKAFVNG